MPKDLDLHGLQELMTEGDVQLIEVLPEKEFAEEHIEGAINIPLKSMDRRSVAHLDPSRPTIVYCWDDT